MVIGDRESGIVGVIWCRIKEVAEVQIGGLMCELRCDD